MMRIDDYGLPRDLGASDGQDSVRLAALSVAFGFKDFDLERYVLKAGTEIPLRDEPDKTTKFNKDLIVRHPNEYKFTLSRDQFRCAITGFWAQDKKQYADLKYVNGIDIMAPSVHGQIDLIHSRSLTWLQEKNLFLDTWWHCNRTPLEEPCQLLSAMLVADKVAKMGLMKYWVKNNIHWEYSIRRYFYQGDGKWRGGQELAEHLVEYIAKAAE